MIIKKLKAGNVNEGVVRETVLKNRCSEDK